MEEDAPDVGLCPMRASALSAARRRSIAAFMRAGISAGATAAGPVDDGAGAAGTWAVSRASAAAASCACCRSRAASMAASRSTLFDPPMATPPDERSLFTMSHVATREIISARPGCSLANVSRDESVEFSSHGGRSSAIASGGTCCCWSPMMCGRQRLGIPQADFEQSRCRNAHNRVANRGGVRPSLRRGPSAGGLQQGVVCW